MSASRGGRHGCRVASSLRISSAGGKADSKIAAIASHYFPSRQATAELHVARPVWHHRPGVPAIGRCFCCFLQQNISQVSVVRLRLAGFSIGMRLRKQQRTWLFLAVFERARPAADRKCMAAGDYQFDSEIASVIPILSITSSAAQALGRLFATRLKRRLRVMGWTPPDGICVPR